MPSSRASGISTIVHVVKQLDPESILDVGVGFGKWGFLFREYTDVVASEHDESRYPKKGWRVRIDGVEGYPGYLTPVHDYVYDEIHVGLIQDLADGLPRYDVVFVGDMIEHLSKETGHEVLGKLLDRANKALVVTTPKFDTHQGELVGNVLEQHESLWEASDFKRYTGANVRTVDHTLLVAVIVKRGVPVPRIRPQVSGLPKDGRLVSKLRRIPVLLARAWDWLRRNPA
jgi:hypothetical protein